MDDGTWRREGDACLPRSPLRHGEVLRRSTVRDDEVVVRFDDGEERRYLDHGLQEELISPKKAVLTRSEERAEP